MKPRIGDFGVTATGGFAAKVIRWGTQSSVNHAFVVVGGGYIIEADPSGAKVNHLSAYPHAIFSTDSIALSPVQRLDIEAEAHGVLGTPYGWPDIACIALAQRRLGGLMTSANPIAKRINREDRLICSQLVDLVYARAGVHLFNDGRLPGLVSPGDLLDLIIDGRHK